MRTTRSASAQSAPSQQIWPGRSHVAIFVRCLHLLDLDLLEDWPGVNEHAFTAKAAQQNLQQRVKAVEWSLYRLFEIYDPDETKDKLRPFFPPATQLQSLNLRAALHRALTELKKNGVLGKDALLRKTMLDDCKGDRFEEVIANFAMAVLRKSYGLSGLVPKTAYTDLQLLPMILAYRNSLHRSLQTRTSIDAATLLEQQRLQEAAVNLQERLEEVESRSLKVDPARKKELRSLVNRSWIGNQAWIDVLLQGIPTENALGRNDLDDTASGTTESRSLLRDLDERISRHQSRLSQWKIIAKDLKSQLNLQSTAAKPEPAPAKRLRSARFVEHRNLNMARGDKTELQELPMSASYASLLDDMKQELDVASSNARRSKEEDASLEPARAVAREPSVVHEVKVTPNRIPSHSIPDDVDETAVPDVDAGQNDTTGEPSQAQSSPTTDPSSFDDSPWFPQQLSNTTALYEEKPALPMTSSPAPSEPSQDPSALPSNMWMSLAERTRATMSLTGRQSILADPDSPTHQDPKAANKRTIPDLQLSSDEDRRGTLFERTRKSMSLFASSSSRPKRKSLRAEKRASQLFPVNQFETPGKPRPHLQTQPGTDWLAPHSGPDPSSGASTPRDKLFDEDAEYASVFKSRPKIALSPAFSPKRSSSVGLDSILEREFDVDTDEEVDMDRLDLESD